MKAYFGVTILAKALRLIRHRRRGGRYCERYTAGACRFKRHLRPNARYLSDRWCQPCIAAEALEKAGLR